MTIIKKHFEDELRANHEGMSQEAAKFAVGKMFEHIAWLLSKGHALKLPKLGYLTASYKEAGRPVRKVKGGESFKMGETHNINIRKRRNKDHIKLNWSDVIDSFADSFGKEVSETFLNQLLTILTAIHEGKSERMEIRGLGSFSTRTVRGRMARNPKNGDRIWKDPRTAVHFKAGRNLVRRVNQELLGHA